MFTVRARFDIASVRRWVRVYSTQIDRAMRVSLTQCAQMVADDARQRHTFTNRTGKLERSIKGLSARGSFLRGTLHAEVIADTKYARFVEEKVTYREWAYLRPAMRRMRATVVRTLTDALTLATRRGR